jgi:hypothetical protein
MFCQKKEKGKNNKNKKGKNLLERWRASPPTALAAPSRRHRAATVPPRRGRDKGEGARRKGKVKKAAECRAV